MKNARNACKNKATDFAEGKSELPGRIVAE